MALTVLAFPSLHRGQLNCIRDVIVVAFWLGMLFSITFHKFKCLLKWDMLKEDVITAIYQQPCESTIWLNSSSTIKLGNWAI